MNKILIVLAMFFLLSVTNLEAKSKPKRLKVKKQQKSMMHKVHKCNKLEKFKIKESKRYKTGKRIGRNLGRF